MDADTAALAERQHGVVSRPQLAQLGLTSDQIDHRVRSGRLHSVHRGVYAVGHALLTGEGRWMAAVLASGPGAVLSHRSAAKLWGLIASSRTIVDVSSPRALRALRGVERHRYAVAPDERTTKDGIPVTTPFRTLLDLAQVATPRQLERALSEATVLRLTDAVPMALLLERHRRRRGTSRLRRALDRARAGPTLTRSELEERFFAFAETHGLPRPATNVTIRLADFYIEADIAWRAQRLIVEVDTFGFHGHRAAFERDRERDRALGAFGWRTVRVTDRHLEEDAGALARDLRAMLDRAGYRNPQ